jgi:hypothetical protein
MNTVEPTKKITFHDCSLTEMSADGDRVRLQLADVWIGDNNHYNATIDLGGVRRMIRDDEIVNTLCMEAKDAAVLTFERSGNIVSLVVTWISHATRTDQTRSYEFDFTTFDLQAEKQE